MAGQLAEEFTAVFDLSHLATSRAMLATPATPPASMRSP
jgi:hypothetical protein